MADGGRRELDARMERVDALVQALESCTDIAVREQVRELLATLMEFHGVALARVLELLGERTGGPQSETVVDALGKDPIAGALLLLYGLHPASVEERILEALEQVRPALSAHRGDVELLGTESGTVRLRLKGTCNGCPSSTTTFRQLIEGAIRQRAPEIERIEVEGLVSR